MGKFFFSMPFGEFRRRLADHGNKDDHKPIRAFLLGRLIIMWDVKK